MLLIDTLVVLALWLGFVWFVDPDGFQKRACTAKAGFARHRRGGTSEERLSCAELITAPPGAARCKR